jgi:hypothetical protein
MQKQVLASLLPVQAWVELCKHALRFAHCCCKTNLPAQGQYHVALVLLLL